VDPVLKWTSVGRQLGYAGYLFLDNLTVVSYTTFLGVEGEVEGGGRMRRDERLMEVWKS
jgi:hypothetical protein